MYVSYMYVQLCMYFTLFLATYTSFNSQLKGRGGDNSALLTLKHFNSKIQFFKKEKKKCRQILHIKEAKKNCAHLLVFYFEFLCTLE